MQIKNEKPPNYEKVKKAFAFDEKRTIFTYGDCIYNPAGINMTMDLQMHELVHMMQQQQMGFFRRWFGPWRWWRKYLKDTDFRFEQELAAYQSQYRFAMANVKDRNQKHDYLVQLARALMGPMYGNIGGKGGLYGVMTLIKQAPLHD